MKKIFVLFVLCCSYVLLVACSPPTPALIQLGGNTMGTTYSVIYVNNEDLAETLQNVELQAKIDQRLVAINQLMSTYIDDSELSKLNNAPAQEAFTISSETKYVLKTALQLGELSDGKLDITVGPLVNLWGFGPDFKPNRAPTSSQLDELQDYVGLDKFYVNGNQVVKKHDNVYIDLSTIAKGYGVDQIAELLLSHGIENFLVEIGGEMRVAGTKPNNVKWRVAIEKPVSGQRVIQKVLKLTDVAVATSGDYRNYFEEDGKRYSHLIDPDTGEPIQHNLVSVTVVAKQSIIADGLATALIVMGAENGLALAEKEGIAALFITKNGDEFTETLSTRLVELLGDEY